MKIGSNYNQSFGMKITNNEAYQHLMKLWNAQFKPRDVEKALAKIKGCEKDAFELTFTDLEVNTKTNHTGVEFSYTNEPYYKRALVTPYAIKIVKPTGDNRYELLNPKEVAKDIVEGLGYYKHSIRYYIGK